LSKSRGICVLWLGVGIGIELSELKESDVVCAGSVPVDIHEHIASLLSDAIGEVAVGIREDLCEIIMNELLELLLCDKKREAHGEIVRHILFDVVEELVDRVFVVVHVTVHISPPFVLKPR